MIVTLLAAVALMQEMRPAGSQESLPDPPSFTLPALTAKQLEEAKARTAGRASTGTQRGLPANVLKKGKWQKRRNGSQVWRLQLSSTGASALRVHFVTFDVKGGSVWLYGPGAKSSNGVEGPLTGRREPFWSGLIYGNSVVLEYTAADGRKVSKLPFAIALLSHQY